ncbi:class A beta-lactamase [Rhizobium sp. EC-SD404]|uniref:class A beta-lactamase n=1 Tax=Rhizobium sp. EC-SD404 TaxID=2038389 RepID=UPI00125C4DA8|nr:class A beta-lactamase [Rhizobium sp. EC-SD404]VVS98819.1 Beta-lactamase [Rhizobium sp. EC-SD404]
MTPRPIFTQHTFAALAMSILSAGAAYGQDAGARLQEVVSTIEEDLGARVGIVVRDTGSDWQWAHREDERFLMNSTFKSVLCGAVLQRAENGELALTDALEIEASDIQDYAPVAETRVGETMTVGELCLATLDMSDNTAANLLIDRLGGPQEVTAFVRTLGDGVTRLDRWEPEMNTFAEGDPRDTTTPSAMAASWEAMLLGDGLSAAAQDQLVDWMSIGGVTGALLRASTPDDWLVADKSGSGNRTRNLVAMVTPPDEAPYLVSIYLSDTSADFETRNAAVTEVGAAIVDLIETR